MKTLFYNKHFLYALFAAALLTTAGCVAPQKPQMTSLQLQSIQARTFKTTKRLAFNSVLTVFQDLGYIVSSANYDTGFITAESPTTTEFSFIDGGRVIKKTKTTAFIRKLRNGKTRVRLNFVNHKEIPLNKGSKTVQDKAVITPSVYQNAFNKIRECLFITSNVDA
ncbi:MAG: hypothetical protein K9L78_04650 [Victivallales bacterium]|nr:hypothetical protein [Victivallales bacterium]MCF7889392.1 hypothetical protein [Victivallales bacterium]